MILLKNRDRNPSFKSGKYVEINDAGNYPMELSVDGVCEQETTTGKQLLDYDNLTNIGQLTKINPYGFRITGTKAWTYGNFTIDLKANTKYTFKCLFNQIDEMSSIEVSIREKNGKIIKDLISSKKNGILIGSFTTETITKITFYLYSNLSATPMTTTCDFTYLQIVEGEYTDETMPDFEPYTGCQPSPNPDFPQEIKTLTGNLKLTSAGKNLLDYVSNLIASGNGLTSVINEDGSITTTGKPTSNYSTITKTIDITDILEDKSTYTISQNFPANLFVQINITKLDGTLKYLNSNKGSSSFIVDKSIYSSYTLVIQTNSMETWGDSPLTITNKYMLCKGTDTADTSFEPYQGSSLNITIPSNEFVGKLDDTYKDTLNVVYKEDGKYHLILNKMVGKVVLNGSEEYTNSGLSSNNYIHMMKTIINNIKSAANDDEFVPVMSNYFSNGFSYRSLGYSIAGTNGITIAQNNTLTICHPNYTKENTEGFKNWLSTHNTEVYYALATSYEVDLGIVDTLLSYDEITNVFSDSDLLPIINVKYYKDFEFDKILRSGYNIDEQEYEIAKKQMANGKRKRILSSYVDCIIKINLGLLDNKTYQEYKEQLDDGEFHYWSYKYNQYKKANFILTKPSITTEYAYDDDIGIDDMEITLEKSSDVS